MINAYSLTLIIITQARHGIVNKMFFFVEEVLHHQTFEDGLQNWPEYYTCQVDVAPEFTKFHTTFSVIYNSCTKRLLYSMLSRSTVR